MKEDLESKAKLVEWKLYLTRPFDLFHASVWNHWYDSKEILDLFGVQLQQGLLVEYPKGMVRHYRSSKDLDVMFEKIARIAESDLELSRKLLELGEKRNKEALELIDTRTELSLADAIQLSVDVALTGTIFPMFAGEQLLKKYGESGSEYKKSLALRATSYYPQVFSQLVMPAARKCLEQTDKDFIKFLEFMTFKEVVSGKFDSQEIIERSKLHNQGQHFIYMNDGENEVIQYTPQPLEFLKTVDPDILSDRKEIKGSVGYKGKVSGKVRIVLHNDLSKISFEDGDVLVAVSTNPILVPIIKKSSAVITDEGGSLCHAAIISRELGIPCIVGTKNATKVLKDGDMVEVDAEKGIVTILKN